MSNEENTEQQADPLTEQPSTNAAKPQVASASSTADKVGNIISMMLQLKEKNPKVFFGAIGGVVVLLILMMVGGEEAKPLPGPVIKNLVVGQKYMLKSPNSYDPAATVRLVTVPGSMPAFDDTELADRNAPCQHLPQGTPVTVIELQDVPGAKFVKVQMDAGDCKGKDGWALAISVQ